MRFKCEHRRQIHPMGLSALRPPGPIPREVHERLFPGMNFDYPTASLEKTTHGAFPYPGYPNFRLPLPSGLSTTTAADLQGAMLPSPASSSSSASQPMDKHSPSSSERSLEGREPWSSSRASPGKRSLDDPEPEISAKRHASEGSSPKPSSPPSPVQERPRSTDSQHSVRSNTERVRGDTPVSVSGGSVTSMEPKLDRNQNISSDVSDDENLSAFRKVEKRADISPPLTSHLDRDSSPPSTLFSPTPINGLKPSLPNQSVKTFPSTLPHPSFLPRLALLPGNAGMPPSFMPGTNSYNENLPLNMSDLYRNSLNAKFGNELSRPTSEKLTDIRNIENNNLHTKMAFLSNPARTMAMRMSSYYKSHNPMVEKLLTTPAIPQAAPFTMALTQNWCAKCNATFRMTSDLVYHMRSQHKQEPAVKKKREDKLKCTVCGETFRERHHLTRHMTSHQ